MEHLNATIVVLSYLCFVTDILYWPLMEVKRQCEEVRSRLAVILGFINMEFGIADANVCRKHIVYNHCRWNPSRTFHI